MKSGVSTDNSAWLDFYWKTDIIRYFVHNHFSHVPYVSFMIGSEMVITSRGMFMLVSCCCCCDDERKDKKHSQYSLFMDIDVTKIALKSVFF